jgi:hypothetical protein
VVIPGPGVETKEELSDTTVLVAQPAVPVDITGPRSQPVVVRPSIPDPTETGDPDIVVTDPDESVVVAEPVTPPVTEDPDVEEPTDLTLWSPTRMKRLWWQSL